MQIIEYVLGKLPSKSLHVGNNVVGMESRLKEINLLIRIESEDVRMIGIFGIGGMGKTTIIKAVHNQISYYFDGISFLENISEVSKEHRGLLHLQEQLLSDILPRGNKNYKIKINTLDEGINRIKERLYQKKVLIILDDVDDLKQLECLAGRRDWFGRGSKIIITTRDKHLLIVHGADEFYEPKELTIGESLVLFSQYAFKKNHPHYDFLSHSNLAVSCCKGLPLALKVLGSFLFSKTHLQWKSELDKLQRVPHIEILNVLKVSYEGLSTTEKDIFLDIACFFKGEDKDFVIRILDGCGFFAESGIRVLNDRCLITILDKKLWMHDLIQQLGWQIVYQQGPKEVGRRSRLWDYVDVHRILTRKKVPLHSCLYIELVSIVFVYLPFAPTY